MNDLRKEEQRRYQNKVNERMPKSETALQCVKAFCVGGLICVIGQFLNDCAIVHMGLDKDMASTFTCIVLIFIAATLTGLGIYDKIGRFAGAGSVVPITGFANSIVAPAMEHRVEGYVMGIGANLFTIAGPVLVYGISASVICGLITCLIIA